MELLETKQVSHLSECAKLRRLCRVAGASNDAHDAVKKLMTVIVSCLGDISVVILIRTDTTLDHSQKAEKVWRLAGGGTAYSGNLIQRNYLCTDVS